VIIFEKIFVDLDVSIDSSGKLRWKTYDKRSDFPFRINRVQRGDSNIATKTVVGTGIGQLLRCKRTNLSCDDFIYNNKYLFKDYHSQGVRKGTLRRIKNKYVQRYNTKIDGVAVSAFADSFFDWSGMDCLNLLVVFSLSRLRFIICGLKAHLFTFRIG
jgi:hypothetical protein